MSENTERQRERGLEGEDKRIRVSEYTFGVQIKDPEVLR